MGKQLLMLLWFPGLFLIITVAQLWVVDFGPSDVGGWGPFAEAMFWQQFSLKIVLTLLLFFGIIFNRGRRRKQSAPSESGPAQSDVSE